MNQNEFENLWGSEVINESFDGWTITDIENALFVMYPDMPVYLIWRLAQETLDFGR